MKLDNSWIFLCGFLGSFAAEVINVYQLYAAAGNKKRVLPPHYKSIGFWIIRFLLAVIAGGLAIAYEIDKALPAINIGIATPLIIKALGEGVKPSLPQVEIPPK